MNYGYVKVLLYGYPKLVALAEAVSASVEIQAALSFKSKTGAAETAERIADDIFVCKNLEGVKTALDEVCAALSDEERFFLEYKYFRRRKELQKYGACAACSERSYFRRQNTLLKKVAALLAGRG